RGNAARYLSGARPARSRGLTMHILDTDTLSRLHAGDPRVQKHTARFNPQEVVTTVITRIEILRGRFAFVLNASDGKEVRRAKEWLRHSEDLLSQFAIVPLTGTSAE